MLKNFFILTILIASSLLGISCVPQPVAVEGKAMLPTLTDGDRILVDQNFRVLKRGDIVVFLYPKDKSKWYIKRIVGLPNENIEIRQGKVFINGELLEESYVDPTYNQAQASFKPTTIEGNSYFILGDNRDNSSDSRSWGTLPKELIKGKFLTVYSNADKQK